MGFKNYMGNISQSVIKVLGSEETNEMVQLIYDLTKSEIKSINYNSLQPALYSIILQLKTVLLKPNFKELGKTLFQTQNFIEKSMWKFKTGRWPEMEAFVDNFGSNATLSEQFIRDVKEMLDKLDMENVENIVHPIVEKIASFMERIANGDEDWIRQLFRNIRASEWDKTVAGYITATAAKLSSGNLATLASRLPSYDDIKTAIINNAFFQSIESLLFQDWPQDEIYPASIEDFVRRIYDTRFPIFNAFFSATKEGLNHETDT